MKLTKKIIAVAAALAMTMTSFTGVFAEETVEGDAVHVNRTVYKVTLPTTTGIKFTLDPQGLLTLDENGQGGSSRGAISGAGVMSAYSESSVDVVFSAKFYVDAPTSLSLADDPNDIVATAEAICLQINTDDSKQKTTKTSTPPAIETLGRPVTVTGTALTAAAVYTVTLQAVDYITTGTAATGFSYIKDPNADNASYAYMAIGGRVAEEADWSAYAAKTKAIKVKAVFGFKKTDGTAIDGSASSGSASSGSGGSTGDSSSIVTYSIASGATITLPFKNIGSIKYGGDASALNNTLAASSYSMDKTTKVLTLNKGIFTANVAGKTRYMTITSYDGTQSVDVTLNVTN